MIILKRIHWVLFEPTEFFNKIFPEKGIKNAFLYLMVLTLFSSVMVVLVKGLYTPFYELIGIKDAAFISVAKYALIMAVFYPINILGSFILAGILHVWVIIFGGKDSYTTTYKLYVYSRTPSLVMGWVPFIGIFTLIYNLALLIIGTQQMHKISRKTSILMYVIPFCILFILLMAFTALMFFLFMKSASNPALLAQLKSGGGKL